LPKDVELVKKEIVAKLNMNFEEAAYQEDGVEYWFARDLQVLLNYAEWRNFLKVVEKAKTACENSDQYISDHFVDVNKTINMPKGATKQIGDIMLTRYACYLIAQNGDSKKEQIAFAQSYFAIQTRKQELLEERIEAIERLKAREKLTTTETEFSKLIYERDVDKFGFGRIRSKGDKALFGYATMNIKKKLGVPKGRPLADFLPTITIKAKDFATEITNFNVKKDDLVGEIRITDEHVKNNTEVRLLLVKSNIIPEELPPAEDAKKLERKVKSDSKKLLKGSKPLHLE
jgi:DNA-damage-inducible protein D